jgi:hypothetical protein
VRLALAAGMCLLAASASAAPLPRYGAFVYRSFCVEQGSGDTGGIGLTVIRSKEGDAALYEYTEGAIEWPLLADELKIDDAGHLKAHFASVEKGVQADVRMEASLNADAAVVVSTNAHALAPGTRLPRVTDLGAKFPACKVR